MATVTFKEPSLSRRLSTSVLLERLIMLGTSVMACDDLFSLLVGVMDLVRAPVRLHRKLVSRIVAAPVLWFGFTASTCASVPNGCQLFSSMQCNRRLLRWVDQQAQ
ncbi:Uncharacterized protein HZ326_22564 [Fusarium oxysporum f. sp. albedinis]|nr:Uncharacterized protein HZ326_22564 [Fusarium oxysporum f. sp. albedinis]